MVYDASMRGTPSFGTVLLGVVKQRFWFVVHNVVAHPLMAVLPSQYGTAFHDWTAQHMDGDEPATPPRRADVANAARLAENLSAEALEFLGRHRGPITMDALRRATAITNRELN